MTKLIHKLTLKEFNLLPDYIYKKIKGKYILQLDGQTYYGFYSAKDIKQALKPQKVEAFYKLNERN